MCIYICQAKYSAEVAIETFGEKEARLAAWREYHEHPDGPKLPPYAFKQEYHAAYSRARYHFEKQTHDLELLTNHMSLVISREMSRLKKVALSTEALEYYAGKIVPSVKHLGEE